MEWNSLNTGLGNDSFTVMRLDISDYCFDYVFSNQLIHFTSKVQSKFDITSKNDAEVFVHKVAQSKFEAVGKKPANTSGHLDIHEAHNDSVHAFEEGEMSQDKNDNVFEILNVENHETVKAQNNGDPLNLALQTLLSC